MPGQWGFITVLGCLILWAHAVQADGNDILHSGLPAPTDSLVIINGQQLEQQKSVSSALDQLHLQGFLLAQTDSIRSDSVAVRIYIDKGQKFTFLPRSTNISPMVARSLGLDNYINKEPLAYPILMELEQKILNHFANYGYPFARLHKKDITISDQVVGFDLELETMDHIVFDSINVAGDVHLTQRFLENHLGIVRGQPYAEARVQQAEKKIRELDFVQLTGPVQISFSPGKASLLVPLQKIRANQFDGIAGFAGGQNEEDAFQLSGLLNLYLSNTLGMGEYLQLSWQGHGQGTQILDTEVGYPYPFGLPLSTEFTFALHKQDSSWLQVQTRPVIFVNLTPTSRLGAFWHYTSNSLISTTRYQQGAALPENLDFSMQLYGLEFRSATLAFQRELLQSGYSLKASASAGHRRTRKNVNLPESIYQDMDMKVLQLNGFAVFEKRWQTGSRATLSLGGRGAYLGGRQMPQNLMIRLGGFKTLKGFDEMSLPASAYALGNAEFRFFTAPRNFFSLFVNGGWFEQRSATTYTRNLPLGAGTGIHMETEAGIFAIYVAVGKLKETAWEFRNAKIHVGYTSRF